MFAELGNILQASVLEHNGSEQEVIYREDMHHNDMQQMQVQHQDRDGHEEPRAVETHPVVAVPVQRRGRGGVRGWGAARGLRGTRGGASGGAHGGSPDGAHGEARDGARGAGGLEIGLDIAVFSADKVFIHDMRCYFENNKYICK